MSRHAPQRADDRGRALAALARSRARRRALPAALALSALACGARTGAEVLPPPPDGGPPDAGRDAFVCVPRPGGETCNGLDDDCDGRIDEDTPLGALGEVVVLRDDTELDAGDCSSCFWAWSPILAPAEGGGWRSIFRISIYGGREEPNLFVRPLDAHGVPLGPNASAGGEVALHLRALAPGSTRDGRRAIAACWRIGSRDVPGLMRVARDGTITRDVYDDAPYCEEPELVGDRIVSVLGVDRRAEVRSRRLDGTDRRTTRIELPEVFFVRAAAWDDRVGVVLLQILGEARQLFFAVLDARGEVVVAPHALDVPWESYPRLVGTSEGWLLVMPGSRDAPAQRAPLTHDGFLLEPLAPFDDGHALGDATLTDDFVHHPSAPLLAHVFQTPVGDLHVRMHVQLLDERGRLLRAFEDDAPGASYVASPSIVFAEDGRLLVTWHDGAADYARNRVYLRELGCGR